ncbi:MAG: gliding motility-associated C-terminal domain-containing protein [Saprospiraceae bacterium]
MVRTNRYFIVETTKLCADLYGESTTALRIFDRWGKIITGMKTTKKHLEWHRSVRAPLPAGTYYYVLNIHHERGMEQVTG